VELVISESVRHIGGAHRRPLLDEIILRRGVYRFERSGVRLLGLRASNKSVAN